MVLNRNVLLMPIAETSIKNQIETEASYRNFDIQFVQIIRVKALIKVWRSDK